ncbi:phasin family protein [Paraburkholderia sp. SIMBA_030]|uniref:phasin family protein n=1 Tax=Paraburkholderia sp. SIMBA_030 TaxID=3085773 RepID=UPI0039799DFB
MESSNTRSLFANYTGLIGKFKVPGFDLAAMLERRRKDIGAFAAINATMLAGMQSLGQKQADMLNSTVTGLQSLVTKQPDTSARKPLANAGELVQQALSTILSNAQEVTSTVHMTQSDSYAIVSKRVAENVEELKALLQPGK